MSVKVAIRSGEAASKLIEVTAERGAAILDRGGTMTVDDKDGVTLLVINKQYFLYAEVSGA